MSSQSFVVDQDQLGAGTNGQRPIADFYIIGEEARMQVQRFRAGENLCICFFFTYWLEDCLLILEAITYNIRFRNIYQMDQLTLRDILGDILQHRLANFQPGDRIGVELNHVDLDRRVWVPFSTVADMSVDRIFGVLERIQQSKQSFQFDQNMTMKLVIIQNPSGAGKGYYERTTTRLVNCSDWKKKHTGHGGCFVQVNNNKVNTKKIKLLNNLKNFRLKTTTICV